VIPARLKFRNPVLVDVKSNYGAVLAKFDREGKTDVAETNYGYCKKILVHFGHFPRTVTYAKKH
jgi:hypothetical protein